MMQELIQHCDVIEECQLKAAISNTYARKKLFKRLSHADQDREGRQLLESGDSAAAFFDLNSLRSHSKRRNTKVGSVAGRAALAACRVRLVASLAQVVPFQGWGGMVAQPALMRLIRAAATSWCWWQGRRRL